LRFGHALRHSPAGPVAVSGGIRACLSWVKRITLLAPRIEAEAPRFTTAGTDSCCPAVMSSGEEAASEEGGPLRDDSEDRAAVLQLVGRHFSYQPQREVGIPLW